MAVFAPLATISSWLRRHLGYVAELIAAPPSIDALPPQANLADRLSRRDQEFLQVALDLAKRSYDDEEKRTAIVEGKATTLVSALGIIASIVVAVTGLLVGTLSQGGRLLPAWVLIAFVLAFVEAVMYLWLSLRLALFAVAVSTFHRPSPTQILEVPGNHPTALLAAHTTQLVEAYLNNKEANHWKAGALADAQRAFAIAGTFLLVSASIIVLYVLITTLVR